MKTRRVPLIIGLVLALGTGVLLLGYLRSLRPSGIAAQTRPVLVAKHDIAARAPLASDQFTVEQRIASQVDSDAISEPNALAGSFALVSIPAGSVVTSSKIALMSAATLPAKLPIGMRAASIAIDNVKGIAGLVAPGDRVDVIAVPARAGNETPRGYAILRGVLVLAMGSDVQATTAAPPGIVSTPASSLSTVTLALTPSQVDLLAGADMNTTLRLALRNPKEPIGAFPAEVLTLAAQGSAPNAAPAATAPPKTTAPAQNGSAPSSNASGSGVIVIDGDQVQSGTAGSR
jgi:pilus assembly protein CpaB